MKIRFPALLLVALLAVVLLGGAARGEIPQKDAEMAGQVFQRLLAVAAPVEGLAWPPRLELKEETSVNAYATAEVKAAGLPEPKIVVTAALLGQVIEGDPDRLAYVMGHELAHITLGHLKMPEGAQTPFLCAAVTRDMEFAADRKGMEYALASGFSFTKAVKAIKRLIALGMEYSTFHSLNVDHPSWKERMACLDTEQSTLWKAMSSFESGVILLTVEQFGPAEQCFRKVTKEFPSCFEAWTNRGYALLMQYCDNLEADDLKGFDVGQIVCGGFYRRPGSLPTVRGRDPEVWWEAVGSLREAMRLNPDSTLTKANLGLAYLVAPEGKDVAKAARFLQEAVEMVEKDSSLDPVARAAVYINAGVAGFAEGKGVSCATLLGKAEEQIALYAKQQRRPPESVGVSAALLYNKALLRAAGSADEKKAAAADMARYLTSTSPSSVWWPVAYSHYVELCRQQGLAPKGESDLKAARQPLRPIIGVELAKGVTVALTDKVEELDRLGQSEVVRVIGNLRRLRYLSYGTELLVSGQVLAICLKGSQAPPLPVRAGGLGGKTSLLKVGMAQQELEEVLGNEDYDFRQLDDPQVHYRFYRSLGIAVRVKQKVVQELVVVQIPERSM